MIRTLSCSLAGLALWSSAAFAQALPSVDAVVDNETIPVRADCTTRSFGDGFVSRADVDGNGRDDIVLNFSQVNCDGSATRYCSDEGCSVVIYLQDEQGRFEYLDKFPAMNVAFDQPNAMWPSFSVTVGGPDCRKGAFQSCLRRYEIRHGKLWLRRQG